jgi:hypothetical protein
MQQLHRSTSIITSSSFCALISSQEFEATKLQIFQGRRRKKKKTQREKKKKKKLKKKRRDCRSGKQLVWCYEDA